MIEKNKIKSFWEWFMDNEELIKEIVSDESHTDRVSLVHSLDNQILEFGMFTWEIGPGSHKPFFLTISPNGDKKLLEISKLIMKSSPKLADWEFNHSKPVKDWNLKFTLYDGYMIERNIDASVWNYVVLQTAANKMEIIIEAANINKLDDETQLIAAELVVTSMLGEERKINEVSGIRIVKEFEKQLGAAAKPILSLRQENGPFG
jgi:hypothetical protein